jgi:hypothetical protein
MMIRTSFKRSRKSFNPMQIPEKKKKLINSTAANHFGANLKIFSEPNGGMNFVTYSTANFDWK